MNEEGGVRLPGHQTLDDDVLMQVDGEWRLAGSRCTRCGATYYPPRRLCPHDLSDCHHELLSRTGVIYEAATVRVAPQGFTPPYRVAYVDLPEGVRVFAPLEWHEDTEPYHGATATYSIRVVRDEPYEVLGPVFAGPDGDTAPPAQADDGSTSP